MENIRSLLLELMSNVNFQSFAMEENIVRDSLILKNWATSSSAEKQSQRERFLKLGLKNKSVSNMDYYKSMIVNYNNMLNIINNVNAIYQSEIKHEHYMLLKRLTVLLLLEIDNIDEDILPRRHVPTSYFQSLVNQIKEEMPEIDLSNFIDLYDDMYKHWTM